jgi:outer membrane receptor protein involved in Fe transport
LHLERALTKGLKANLSYSRRIAWPNINDLDPTLRFIDSTTASGGNPALRPETTDSFEAKLKVEKSNHSGELVLYARETHDLLSNESDLVDGVLVSRPVNVGKRISRGVSFSAQGPLVSRLRYSLTGNLSWQEIRDDNLSLGIESKHTEYSGSAQLEYKDGVEGRRGADRIEVRARYSGPTHLGFYKIDDYFTLNGSWTHTFSYRWSSVLTVSDMLGPPELRLSSFSEDTVSRQTDRAAATRVNVALSYRLGAKSQ